MRRSRFKPEQLQREAFRLYEQFRPEIPEGVRGWGAKGELDLARMRQVKMYSSIGVLAC